ncbi:MAG: hypothetical protein KBG20_15050 [Caldilineaceae bacterium]|nr:hypothetical protein [Caldilineaceae bacterium]MBP8110073.1 hypothetical protein [Caldilineaceae bacterium]MBP8125080.1 hypothetical protein [Caldilineaceae bacterium]MBP9073623.1 hypothetical protein [Caldilineaceae bacterium]
MSNKVVDKAREGMGAIEKLISGLPGIRGYREKDLRRDADYRLRQMIAGGLEEQKARLFDLQKQLLKSGGLSWVDDVDGAVTKLQTLADRVKTASYGYAGLFNAQKIKDAQLDALHRFDVALMARVQEVKDAIAGLEAAISQKDGINSAIDALTAKLTELNNLFSQRSDAVDDPDLLTETSAPALDDALLAAAFPTTAMDVNTETDTQSWDVVDAPTA